MEMGVEKCEIEKEREKVKTMISMEKEKKKQRRWRRRKEMEKEMHSEMEKEYEKESETKGERNGLNVRERVISQEYASYWVVSCCWILTSTAPCFIHVGNMLHPVIVTNDKTDNTQPFTNQQTSSMHVKH